MTATSPAFQFYPAEFLADENVVMMSNQELGCYVKLMCYCWREGSIPADVKRIAKLCGEDGSAMADLWGAISSCFEQSPDQPDRLLHPRLERERNKQREFREERVASGKKGAETRWKDKTSTNSSAIAQPMAKPIARDGSLSLSSSSPSSSTSENPAAHTAVVTPTSAREPAPERAAVPEDEKPKPDQQDEPPQRNVAALIASLGSKFTAAAPPPPREITPTRHGLLADFLRKQGIVVTSTDGVLAEWIEMQVTEEQCLQAIELARCRKPEPEKIAARYLDPILRDVVAGKRNGASVDRWWESEGATDRMAKELGITPTGYDTYASLRDKIREKLKGAA